MFNAVRICWLKTYFRQHFELEKTIGIGKSTLLCELTIDSIVQNFVFFPEAQT